MDPTCHPPLCLHPLPEGPLAFGCRPVRHPLTPDQRSEDAQCNRPSVMRHVIRNGSYSLARHSKDGTFCGPDTVLRGLVAPCPPPLRNVNQSTSAPALLVRQLGQRWRARFRCQRDHAQQPPPRGRCAPRAINSKRGILLAARVFFGPLTCHSNAPYSSTCMVQPLRMHMAVRWKLRSASRGVSLRPAAVGAPHLAGNPAAGTEPHNEGRWSICASTAIAGTFNARTIGALNARLPVCAGDPGAIGERSQAGSAPCRQPRRTPVAPTGAERGLEPLALHFRPGRTLVEGSPRSESTGFKNPIRSTAAHLAGRRRCGDQQVPSGLSQRR